MFYSFIQYTFTECWQVPSCDENTECHWGTCWLVQETHTSAPHATQCDSAAIIPVLTVTPCQDDLEEDWERRGVWLVLEGDKLPEPGAQGSGGSNGRAREKADWPCHDEPRSRTSSTGRRGSEKRCDTTSFALWGHLEDELHCEQGQFGRYCNRTEDLSNRDEGGGADFRNIWEVEINRIFWPTSGAFHCQIKIV